MYSSTLKSFVGVNSSVLLNNVEESEKPIILKFFEPISYVSFSPYEECQDLALIVFSKDICIARIKFQEEDTSLLEPVSFMELQKINFNNVLSVNWNPDSSLSSAPYQISFACTSKELFDIKIVRTNIVDEYTDLCICGHSSYVNSIAYEPSGNLLASTSDDLTCRVWKVNNNYEECVTFHLLSPGMVVCWHKTNPGMLLVGEQFGNIRMYNVTRGVALISFQSNLGPLSSVAWLPGDTSYVAALCGAYLVIWRTTSPSTPQNVVMVHPEGGSHLCFAYCSALKLLSIGAPSYTLKCTSIDKPHSVSISSLKLASNMSSHCSLSYIAVGVDNCIYFWKTSDF